jgi:hypothetical protein
MMIKNKRPEACGHHATYGDRRRIVLLTYGGDMFYLTDETRLGGMSVKWQNGADRSIDRSTDRQTKKGPRRPSPLGRGVKKIIHYVELRSNVILANSEETVISRVISPHICIKFNSEETVISRVISPHICIKFNSEETVISRVTSPHI